ncbi:hypothetical protein G7077_01450 [Sphingomonas piscis]|uniref:Right handed beta helix domain-containing protein n=1 Tax=Sphingomonas piscis TaxID=2714943 RepID=A0A6G7YM20_9SPHN|nr:hypothetical protein [Sphingomonas piscis]QIK77777.1 hypothetical protein G7077_01450 [Sphingomonas piscis]
MFPLTSRTLAQGTVVSFAIFGGSPGSSGLTNRTAFAAAVALLSRRGGGTLRVEPGIYPFSGEALLSGRNVTVVANGARFEGPSCRLTLSAQSSAISIVGLSLIDTSGDKETYLLNVLGSACRFQDVHLEKRPAAGGYIAYCRENTIDNLFENLSFAGSNGVFLGGRDHRIIGGWARSAGGDDCWVLKSTIYPCSNIRISGFRAQGFAALVSIGSEVGRRAGVTPLGPTLVRDVLVENCQASECSYFAYIKPGGVGAGRAAYDWQDGVVEDVTIRNCQCDDANGTRFRDGVYVSPGRGATVRRLVIDNLQIRARANSPPCRLLPEFICTSSRSPRTMGAARSSRM